MARVRAIAIGYADGRLQNPGDEFDVADGIVAPWFVAVGQDFLDPVAEPASKGKRKAKASAEAPAECDAPVGGDAADLM